MGLTGAPEAVLGGEPEGDACGGQSRVGILAVNRQAWITCVLLWMLNPIAKTPWLMIPCSVPMRSS